MNVFHRDVHFNKKPYAARAAKAAKVIRGMTDEEVKSRMDMIIKEMDLGQLCEKRDKLLPSMTEGNTESQYNSHTKGMLEFCQLVGDVRSMLMMHKDVKAGMYPSIEPGTIANFAAYKFGTKGSTLCNMKGQIVKDANGHLIECSGKWKDPKNYEQFLATMSMVHKNHGQEGPFQPACSNCYETYFTKNEKKGCTHHRYNPHLMNCGNPRHSMLMQDSVKKFKNHEHIVKSDTALSPIELKRLFDYLFSTWNVYKLQFWVMVLISVHLFLRGDETVDVGFFSIVADLCTYNDNGTISSLMVEIYGKIEKKNKKPVMLVLYTCNSHPWLCPVRFLLLHVRVVGHQSGYMFASCNDLKHMHDQTSLSAVSEISQSRNMKNSIGKETFMTDTTYYVGLILNRNGKIGLHIWRNTACLLAQLSKGNPDEIRKSARHKSYKSYSRYEKDNVTVLKLLEISTEHADLLSLVPKWNSIYVDNRENSSIISSLIGNQRKDMFKSLKHQSDYFYAKILKIESRKLSDLLKPTLEYNAQVTPFKTIISLLEPFDVSIKSPLLKAISDYKNEAVEKALMCVPENYVMSSDTSSFSMVNFNASSKTNQNSHETLDNAILTLSSTAQSSKITHINAKSNDNCKSVIVSKNKDLGKNDLENRHYLKKLKGREKVSVMFSIKTEYEICDKKNLTDKAKSFVRQGLKPFLNCFEGCCKNDVSMFLKDHDEKINHAKFLCCHKSNT